MTHARLRIVMSVVLLALAAPSMHSQTQQRERLRSSDVDRPVTAFVLDMAGDGLQFTSADEGVTFDIDGTGKPVRIGWTKAGADDGFLFLDTNGNGRVDSGRELMGDGWRKPDGSRVVSGDHTLTVIQGVDTMEPGPVTGELTQVVFIDAADEVFARLRFWRDANHNGRSDADELQTLGQMKVLKIFVGFSNAKRATLETGNIRLMEGTFYLQPKAGCQAQPGVRCEVQRRMAEIEFARKK